jgi:hypothetical protein
LEKRKKGNFTTFSFSTKLTDIFLLKRRIKPNDEGFDVVGRRCRNEELT